MKVLHVIPAISPRYGGPSQAVYDMCWSLHLAGCQVQIATTDADGEGRLEVQLGKLHSYQNVPTIFFERQWSEAFKYSHSLAQWLSNNVTEFDVVHIHAVFSHACLAAARACRRNGIPYIVRTIGNLDPWSLGQKNIRKKIFWQLFAKRMMQEAAAIHYTTRDEQRLAETALGLKRGVVIPLGIDDKYLESSNGENAFIKKYPELQGSPYLLSLSRLHPKKNIEALIEAFLKLSQESEFKTWKLVIAGDGDTSYLNELKELVKLHEGIDKVLFVGWLKGDEKLGALRGAELYALPSHQENFGLSVVEAMACGTPVLISEQVNLAADVAQSGAGWVTTLAMDSLSSSLREAMIDKIERDKRGAAARQLVQTQFTWPVVTEKLMTLYRNLTTDSVPELVAAI